MDLVSISPWDDDTVSNWFKVSETHLDMSISSCLVGGHISTQLNSRLSGSPARGWHYHGSAYQCVPVASILVR